MRKLGLAWLFLVAVQISLGVWTIWSNKAADVATAHVAVGAILFAFGVIICAFCLQSPETRVAHPLSSRETVTA